MSGRESWNGRSRDVNRNEVDDADFGICDGAGDSPGLCIGWYDATGVREAVVSMTGGGDEPPGTLR